MYLKKLKIQNFRNYDFLEVDFNDGINIFYGENAQGKTNLLESIYVLGLTKSHRSFIDDNLIKSGAMTAHISGELIVNNSKNYLEIGFQNKKKKLKLNNDEIKKVGNYISNMDIIIFYPEDLGIIKGSPSERRRFLNTELSQLYNNYYNVFNDYKKLLRMRNDRLKYLNQRQIADDNYLDVITESLVEKSILIYKMRKKFISDLNIEAKNIFEKLTNISDFRIEYVSNILKDGELSKDIIIERLSKIRSTELKLGSTLIGPHRDDIIFEINNIDAVKFASQGQQRTAALSLKLSEIEIVKKIINDTPILLLDDVLSELDKHRQNYLLDSICDIQTLITCTGLDDFVNNRFFINKIMHVDKGQVKVNVRPQAALPEG